MMRDRVVSVYTPLSHYPFDVRTVCGVVSLYIQRFPIIIKTCAELSVLGR